MLQHPCRTFPYFLLLLNAAWLSLSVLLRTSDFYFTTVSAEQTSFRKCLKNDWNVCCYPGDSPVWTDCSSSTTPSNGCQFIRDDDESIAARLDQDVIEGGTKYRPSRPTSLNEDVIFNNASASLWDISWGLPKRTQNLKGFLLKVLYSGKENHSWVYKLSAPAPSNTRFHHTCTRAYPIGSYTVSVYSLPGRAMASWNISMIENHFPEFAGSEHPDNCTFRWNGLLRADSRTYSRADITVCFFAAPACYHFHVYQLFLHPSNSTTSSGMLKWHLQVPDLQDAANKVFCKSYRLLPGNYTAALVAKLSNERECGRRGGCNYHITFEVHPHVLLTAPPSTYKYIVTDVTADDSVHILPQRPSIDNNLIIVLAVVIPLGILITGVCLTFVCWSKEVTRVFKRGIYTAMKCGAVVVDVGGDEELERLMVDLSRKLSSKCCTGEIVVIVKSVVAKKEKLNEFKKWLSGSMKEVKRNEEGKIYMVREKSRRQTKMEKVLKLVEKMNFVVMVHSEYSYRSLERCCNEKNRPLDDIFTRILFMYEERRSWMMKEKIERRKEGSKGVFNPHPCLPPCCHVVTDDCWFWKGIGNKNVFHWINGFEDLMAWVKETPRMVEEDKVWFIPEEEEVRDKSIQKLVFQSINDDFDSTVFGASLALHGTDACAGDLDVAIEVQEARKVDHDVGEGKDFQTKRQNNHHNQYDNYYLEAPF